MTAASRAPDARCEVAVIGAGLLGLATARSLTRQGVGVVVLEAVEPGHDLAGSKGTARIFRLGYPDPLYVEMAALALRGWQELEARTGRTLLHPAGQLTFGPGAPAVASALQHVGLACEPLSASDLDQRFPPWRIAGPAFFEPASAVLAADDCLNALRDDGHTTFPVHTRTPVTGLEDDGARVTLHLAEGEQLSAEVVVNCAGARAASLLGPLDATVGPPTVQQVAYFRTGDDPGPASPDPAPIFIEWGPDMLYGLPVPRSGLYKLAQHLPGSEFEPGAPLPDDDPSALALLVDAVCRLRPDLAPTPVATERCLYDNTADSDFVLQRIGRVVLGCGTSGHGFKFGPLLGDLLADLATGAPSPIDLSKFALPRGST